MSNFSRVLSLILLVACTVVFTNIAVAQPKKDDAEVVKKGDNLVEVTCTGSGMNKDEAIRDAQRKAVERGAGTFIYSQSETKDFALVRDTILAKAAGFVQSTDILSTKTADDDVVTVKAKIVVSVKGIEDTWGVVQNLLKSMGRPKIMVFINEKIGTNVVEDSTVGTKIENLLLNSGFQLVDKKQIKEIDKKDMAAAVAEDKPDKMQALAKKFGAQIFISGSAETSHGQAGEAAPGVVIFKYGSKGNVKCYSADSANMFASENDNAFSADRMQNVAADKSLAALGDKIALKIQFKILQSWMETLQGRGEVKLEIEGITLKQANAVAEELKKIKGVTDVPDPEFHNKVAEFNIQAGMPAKELAKKIAKEVDKLEVTDVSQNVIKATYSAGGK